MSCMGSWRRVVRLSCIFLVVFAVVFASQVFAGNIANYPTQKQEQTNWCWAASSVSILRYYGRTNPTQCSFVKTAKSTSSCANVSANVNEVKAALALYSIDSTYYSGNLSWAGLKAQIDSAYPVYVSWGWSSGGGHAVVIYGYSESGTFVNYMDPADGVKTAMTYTNFVGGSSFDRTWRWGLDSIFD